MNERARTRRRKERDHVKRRNELQGAVFVIELTDEVLEHREEILELPGFRVLAVGGGRALVHLTLHHVRTWPRRARRFLAESPHTFVGRTWREVWDVLGATARNAVFRARVVREVGGRARIVRVLRKDVLPSDRVLDSVLPPSHRFAGEGFHGPLTPGG